MQRGIDLREKGEEGEEGDAAFFVVNWQMGENVIMQPSETQGMKGESGREA